MLPPPKKNSPGVGIIFTLPDTYMFFNMGGGAVWNS